MKTWIALFSMAALLTGCGGGGGDATSRAVKDSSGEALTKAELIEQGDAICAKVYAVTETLDAEGTTQEAARFAGLHSGMIKDLLALGAPQETEYLYAEYTTAAKAFAEAEGEVKRYAASGDPAALRIAESSSLSAFSMFKGLAGGYGFKICAG